jgi:hypothetical protein
VQSFQHYLCQKPLKVTEIKNLTIKPQNKLMIIYQNPVKNETQNNAMDGLHSSSRAAIGPGICPIRHRRKATIPLHCGKADPNS